MFKLERHNRLGRKFDALLLLGSVILAFSSTYAEDSSEEPVVKLTTALGVQVKEKVKAINLENEVLNFALSEGYPSRNLSVCVDDGVYISFPIDMVVSVSTKKGKHIVRMKNGQEIEGKLLGYLSTIDNKVYELSGVTAFEVLFVPPPKSSKKTKSPKQIWELIFPVKEPVSYTVIEPAFVFQYYSSSGYLMGGRDHITKSFSFYLKIGDQEHLANIEDFNELNLIKDSNVPEMRVNLESNIGVKTTGTLVLKANDDKGYHSARDDWVVMAQLESDHRIHLAVSQKACTLKKRSRRDNR